MRWILPGGDSEKASLLASALSLHPLAARILVHRGHASPEAATEFLKDELADLPNPFTMKGMDAGVDRLVRALRRQELITLYGDYDVDGVCSTALLSLFLEALGARVAATAGAPDRLERCRELGADIVIDYHDDIAAELKKATDGHGADVILDNMGAKGLAANIDSLAMDGRLVIIGMQGGVKAELNIGALMAKRGSVTSMGLRARPVEGPHGKAMIVAGVRDQVWPMIADGRVHPIVHGTVPMPDAGEAHAQFDQGGVIGKVLLVTPAAR